MRALIVDDEARVRKAVRLLVNWEQHGITEIEEASGGYEAIERMRQDKPAIVIMDMMMPEGSGVDLMAAINELAGTVKFIVVSGRDDFDFVREAVRHGGIDYLLKPIEPDAINTAVAKAAAQWKLDQQERAERHKQSRQLNEFKPVYEEKLLTGLIDDPATAQAALRRLQEEGLVPNGVLRVRLALLQVDLSDTQLYERFARDSELLYFAITNISNEFLQAKGAGIAFRYWGAPSDIVMLVWDQPEQMPTILSEINHGLYVTLQRHMHMGMSEAYAFPEAMSRQYEEALTALRHRNSLESNLYIHSISDITAAKRPLFSDWEEGWRVAALSGQEEQLAAASRQWLDAARHQGVITPQMLEDYKQAVNQFCAKVLREELRQQEEDQQKWPQEAFAGEAPYAQASSFSLHEWQAWSYRLLHGLSELLLLHQSHEKAKMSDIAGYIDQNYQTELSLQDIAKRFFVSREYVSRKFKQEYGINISDYISGIRIDKAKQLMANPNLRIAKVAEMVGFHDEKYFSKVFKNKEGVSPKVYRARVTE